MKTWAEMTAGMDEDPYYHIYKAELDLLMAKQLDPNNKCSLECLAIINKYDEEEA